MFWAPHFRGRRQLKSCSAQRRIGVLGRTGWILGFLGLFSATALLAQNPLPQSDSGQTSPSDACPQVGEAGVRTGSVYATVTCRFAPALASHRDMILGLAQWDHTLLGAFELGERILTLPVPVVSPGDISRVARPVDVVGRFSTSGTHITLDSLAKAWRVDQLQRQGMNLNMKSPYGTFRLTYREIFSGRANSLGGGVGQASAAAAYVTPRFGAGGLLDFSAAALMGNGSINQLLGGGFGNSNIGGFGPHLHKPEGPTVAFKLTF